MRHRSLRPTHTLQSFSVTSPCPNVSELYIEITRWHKGGKNVYHFEIGRAHV